MRKLLGFFLVLIVMLIGAEILLRIIFGLGTPPLMIGDEEIGYLFKENQDLKRFGNKIIYNSYHQRSDHLIDNPDYRILMLGDSVANGGVLTDHKETISEILEDRLNNKYEVSGEVLNASAGSWGIENEHAYLDKFGTFDSDIVILVINTSDLFQRKSGRNVVGTHAFPNKNPFSALNELFDRYIFNFVPNYLSQKFKSTTTFNSKEIKDMTDIKQKQFRKNIDAIVEIMNFVRKNDAQLIILLSPLKRELDDSQFDHERNIIEELQDKYQIITINMLDDNLALRKEHFRDSIHLNPDGNYHVANLLSEIIMERDMLTCCNEKNIN